jgi:hypothetical protein
MENDGSTSARVAAKHGEGHHEGFDRALNQALSQLSSEIGTGNYSVHVEFSADVEVSNPGNIGFYKVTLTRP